MTNRRTGPEKPREGPRGGTVATHGREGRSTRAESDLRISYDQLHLHRQLIYVAKQTRYAYSKIFVFHGAGLPKASTKGAVIYNLQHKKANTRLVPGRAHFFTLADLGTCLDAYFVDEASCCASSADSPPCLSWCERTDFCLG